MLGWLGILGSPFLAIVLCINGIFENSRETVLGGVLSLLYMTGWMCSILGLYRLNAAGFSKAGKIILTTQVLLLSIGDIWNVYAIIRPGDPALLYSILDLSWPLSNIFMFVTGLAILLAKQLKGWKRIVPLIVGLWFPLTVVLAPVFFGKTNTTVLIIGIYSFISWSFLGMAVIKSAAEKERQKYPAPVISFIDTV